VQHTVNCVLRVKGDESEATRALRVLVIHDNNVSDAAEGLEVLPKPILSQSRGQPAHKDLLGPSTTCIAGTASSSSSSTASVPPTARVRGLGGLLLLPRECPLHIDRAAVEGVGVLQRSVDDGGVGEDDEPEAAGAAGDLVAHDGRLRNLAVGGEVLAQLLLRRFPGDAADEELALVRLHLSSSASASASRSPAAAVGEEGERERAELGRVWVARFSAIHFRG